MTDRLDFFGVYDLESTFLATNSDDGRKLLKRIIKTTFASARNDVRFKDYSRFLIVTPRPYYQPNQSYLSPGGLSTIGCEKISTPQGPLIASVGIVFSLPNLYKEGQGHGDSDQNTILHEMLHGFGLGHNNMLNPKTHFEVLPRSNKDLDLLQYGSLIGPMGNFAAQWLPGSQLNELGWLDRSEKILVRDQDRIYRLVPLSSSQNNLKILQIPRVANPQRKTSDFFWLEYRQILTPFDYEPGLHFDLEGALIHYTSRKAIDRSAQQDTILLSFSKNPQELLEWQTKVALKDQWEDPYTHIKFQVLSASKQALDIRVSFGGF